MDKTKEMYATSMFSKLKVEQRELKRSSTNIRKRTIFTINFGTDRSVQDSANPDQTAPESSIELSDQSLHYLFFHCYLRLHFIHQWVYFPPVF